MCNNSTYPCPLWQGAFRPLFLLGAAFSSLVLLLWALQLSGMIQLNTYGSSLVWHAHEMLFGFTLAIVVGFLLTAVRNWTGNASAQGSSLKLLVILWCASRALWLFSESPVWLVALLDMSFPLYAAYWLAKPLRGSGQKHNWGFVFLLLALALVQLVYHWALNYRPELISLIHQAVVLVMANLVFWVGGRILPFFVQSRLHIPRRQLPGWLTSAAMMSSWSLIPLLLLQLSELLSIVAAIACVLHGFRLALYWRNRALEEPMLWSLFIAPCWVLLGFLALALGSSNWLHLITVGGLGGMILTIISRVSLGHVGEPIRALSWMPTAFILLTLAGLIRFVANDLGALSGLAYGMASAGWICGFGLFLFHYSVRLFSLRKDGKAG